MSRRITQRELRNESGRIMRALDKGKAFPRVFVPTEAAVAAFAGAPRIARGRFRKDVDALIEQDPTPLAPSRGQA
jgi:hypothetical protein